jgi:hypothetical protein
MIPILRKEKETFIQRNPNADKFAWQRMVSLKFDTMYCKSKMVDNGQGEIVGIAHDAFDVKAIKMELQELKALDRSEEELSEDGDSSDSADKQTPKFNLTRQFQVFMATTWSPHDTSGHSYIQEFVVARYGLKTVSSEFLIPTILDLVNILWMYGFITIDIVGDGASENRTTFKYFANISSKELLSKYFTADQLKGLPLEFNIAFKHPVQELSDAGMIIVIGGEMPHWVKKFRNALDNKKKKLTFRGQTFCLGDLKEMWEAIGDADVSDSCKVRLFKFTMEHFTLNSFNKMRVFLAVQIPSLTMIEMIEYACDAPESEYCIGDYSSVIDIFRRVNRLVDIMNGKNSHGGKILDVEQINSPTHRHLEELLSILRLFEEWKRESGKAKKKFITKETYEDLCWMVFGTVTLACTYLKSDGSNKMDQGRSGTDPLEHFFCKVRRKNPNGGEQDCRESTSTISAGTGGSHLFSRSGGQNTAKSHVDPRDYFRPMHKMNK